MQYFCPKCGETIKSEEIAFYKQNFSCKACYSPYIMESTKKQYTIHLCSGCLAYVFDRNPKNSLWKTIESKELDQAVTHIIEMEVLSHLSKESGQKYDLTFPPIIDIPSKLVVSYSLSGNRDELTKLIILLKPALCKTCNKLLSRRFDAVIQLRTIKLKSKKPKVLLDSMVDKVIEYAAKIQQKHPNQFVSDIEELPQGFDLKLSNRSMMNSIQSYLTGRNAFIVKTSKKLMGKNPNTGGDLYRTYILLRYIPFQVDNIIRIKNTSYVVKKIQANRIILENMTTRALHTRNFDFFEKKLIEIAEM